MGPDSQAKVARPRPDSVWPAVSYERLTWETPNRDFGATVRSEMAFHRSTYSSAIPADIAVLDYAPARSVSAAAEDASNEIARFDAEMGSEIAPFAAILLRSESVASSQIENLSDSARSVAMAELGDTTKQNATLIVANTQAMRSAIQLSDRLDSESILQMHLALLGAHDPRSAGRGDFYSNRAIAAFAWPLLVQASGLANLSGAMLQLTPKGRRALLSPTPQILREIWDRWIVHGVIDELSRIEHIKGQRSANVLTAVGRRRQIVATALSLLPPDEWMDIDDLFTWMRRRRLDPAISRSERLLFRLHIGHPEYGSLGSDGYGEWSILQGRYTMALLFEIAAPLGIVDVRFVDPEGARKDYLRHFAEAELPFLSRYDGLQAIRVNAPPH